jgi:hypothetical protein
MTQVSGQNLTRRPENWPIKNAQSAAVKIYFARRFAVFPGVFQFDG